MSKRIMFAIVIIGVFLTGIISGYGIANRSIKSVYSIVNVRDMGDTYYVKTADGNVYEFFRK